MPTIKLRLSSLDYVAALRLAERDGLPLHEWLLATIDAEITRRALERHVEWLRTHPEFSSPPADSADNDRSEEP